MRVVQLIDGLRAGGKERQLVELLKGLSEILGVESELIVMSRDNHYTYLDQLNIPTHFLLRKTKRDPLIFYQLYRLLSQIKPDILHSWSSMCSVYALPSVKLLNMKFVNGFLRNAPPKLGVLDKEWRRARLTFPFSDAIVANSKAGLKAYGVSGNKSHCIYNGFDFERLENLDSPKKIRSKLGIKTKYVVGMVASFSDKKDYTTYVNAAQRVLAIRKNVTFLAVGDGKTRPQCMEIVTEKNQPFIIFPGKMKNVESLIQIFDIGVLTSTIYGEGISNSIMEYMALGKPVIATDCGGNNELIENGKSGFIIPNYNSIALMNSIIFLLDNLNKSSKMGLAGASRLRTTFSFRKMVNQYVDLYLRVC